MTDPAVWRDPWLTERASAITIPRDHRVFLTVARAGVREVLEWLVTVQGFTHISTITGSDVGSELEVIYHLAHQAVVVSVRVLVPKDDPLLPTVIDLLPGAAFYEREVQDLVGVVFPGNPAPAPLVLPDGWPRDIHPLRQEWPLTRIKERLEGS